MPTYFLIWLSLFCPCSFSTDPSKSDDSLEVQHLGLDFSNAKLRHSSREDLPELDQNHPVQTDVDLPVEEETQEAVSNQFNFYRCPCHCGTEETTRSTIPLSSEETALAETYDYRSSILERQRANDRASRVAELQTYQWLPKTNKPKAHVVVIHGLHDHTGRMLRLIKDLLKHQYAVYAMDMEGFGRSSGHWGYVDNVMDMVDDVLAYIGTIREAQTEPIPLFLNGFSMGGLISVHTALLDDKKWIDGLVLQAPALPGPKDTPYGSVSRAINRFFKKTMAKAALIPCTAGEDVSPAARKRNKRECANDPLECHGWLQVGTLMAIELSINALAGKTNQVTLPFLLQHGTRDGVNAIAKSQAFHRVASSSDKTFKTYHGANHDLLNEAEQITQPLLQDIITWLDGHV